MKISNMFLNSQMTEKALVITSVQPSCGCTGVVMDEKKEFAQGEEGEIKITFNTQGRQGMNSKTGTVNTNDPANPVMILTFKCEIDNK
ncbi:MAG: DUF1573 domain-containing protein [Ignavibacteria bacterium]|nr:DUF1573 domain-containing protein [Ignavibacteria bacterium]